MIKKSFFFFLIISAFLSGCKQDSYEKASRCWNSKHLEAKLYDVPILVDAQLVQNINNTASIDESNIVSYETSCEYEQACIFYQEEMERLGWWQSAAFKGSEALLNFEKPNKYCSISIRPLKRGSHAIIFMGQKSYS